MSTAAPIPIRSSDPRRLQIAFLSLFLLYVLTVGEFALAPTLMAAVLGATLATQAGLVRALGIRDPGPLSPLISGLSLCLLLRTNSVPVAALAGTLAIASKFVLRWRGKHVFNPTNFGLLVAVLLTDRAWVSPAQWGSGAFVFFFVGALGLTIARQAGRLDISLAFLLAHAGLNLTRMLYLGERPEVFLHRLTSGALILFTFFMISDPRSTPDSRAGRIALAGATACVAYYLQFHLFLPSAPLWALLVVSPLTPVLDALRRRPRFSWPTTPTEDSMSRTASVGPRLIPCVLLAVALATATAPPAAAFCGFFVAKADADLWNDASQVAIVRDGERTVLTMANDYRGELSEFALVVPVPTVLEEGQIHVGDQKLIERLDAFSAPRLVEYHDPDPCLVGIPMAGSPQKMSMGDSERARPESRSLGVTIEAQYTVGEYDILILSATESKGLEAWLRDSGYRLPRGASSALAPYIRQGLKFFVAKVNLDEQARTGYNYLRPLQMAYESPRFMLPIRLGMLNADGPQDLLVYTLTRKGRVESANYRTVKVPSDVEIPVFVKNEFASFYRDLFRTAWQREGQKAVFLEYFWNMSWCDPCAADPLTRDELRQLGVFWLDQGTGEDDRRRPATDGPVEVLLTRLHVRYDDAHFPEDLMFQETRDTANFQGRYILRHPWSGPLRCPAGKRYAEELRSRREREVATLARLTDWPARDIRRKMGGLTTESEETETDADADEAWWKKIWE